MATIEACSRTTSPDRIALRRSKAPFGALKSLALAAALLGAAGLGLPSAAAAAQGHDEAGPSLFAPPNPVPVKAQPRPEASPPQPPDPGPEARTAPPVIELKSPEETRATAAPEAPRPPEAGPAVALPATPPPTPGSPKVMVDSQGNKTLVIHDDQPPQVILDEPDGGQVQILMGDDTAGLVMDSQGRKTLVVRGGPEPAPARQIPPNPPLIVRSREVPAPVQSARPAAGPGENRPYYEAPPPKKNRPYWEVDQAPEPPPYFQVVKMPEPRAYYLPEPEVVEIGPEDVRLAEPEPIQVAALPLAAPVDDNPGITIDYYQYVDERGVIHLSNVPNDPRYRLFTTVVTVQRGLTTAGPRVRFTHDTLRPIIMKASRIYNLDPALIAAVIKSESAFDSRAVSWAGAQGLMQLMPKTARDMGVIDSFDPEDNVMGGSRYLRKMLDQFGGDLTLAIAAYNCGPTRVAKVWRVPNIAETQNYVKIVQRNYNRYRQTF